MLAGPAPRRPWSDPLLAVSDACASLSAAARTEVRDQARLHAFRDRPAVAVRLAFRTFALVGLPALGASTLASAMLPGLWAAPGTGPCIGVAGFAAAIVHDRLRAPWLAPFVDRLATAHLAATASGVSAG